MSNASQCEASQSNTQRQSRTVTLCLAVFALAAVVLAGPVHAEPSDQPAPPLPMFTPTPSNWSPKFPFPYDATRKNVTDADVTAEREMCQWFKAQYEELQRQIDAFGFNLLTASNDWVVEGIQLQADAVVANIDQTEEYLAPRAQALTHSQDFAGDEYFPLYQAESFYRLWQHLSNVGTGIKARNTAWVFGPSVQRVKHWGSRIIRSHVCD